VVDAVTAVADRCRQSCLLMKSVTGVSAQDSDIVFALSYVKDFGGFKSSIFLVFCRVMANGQLKRWCQDCAGILPKPLSLETTFSGVKV